MEIIYLALADKYGNIVANNNDALLTFSLHNNKNQTNSSYSDLYPATIRGKSSFIADNGCFYIDGIIFTAAPG